jgi:hypothetical protein
VSADSEDKKSCSYESKTDESKQGNLLKTEARLFPVFERVVQICVSTA